MKHIIALILVFSFIFPASIFAQETPTDPPAVTGLSKNQKAPFSGVLLNSTAAAQMLTDKKFTLEECQIEIDFELERQKAELDLLLKSTKLSLESTEAKYTSLLDIKDEEIMRLQEIATERPNDYSAWFVAGGVVVGIVLSVAVFAIAVEIKDN